MTDRLTEQEKAANRRKWWGLTDPAEVVAHPAALTDEELAEMQTLVDRYNGQACGPAPEECLPYGELCSWHDAQNQPDAGRLIAALRASRAEVERLRAGMSHRLSASHVRVTSLDGNGDPIADSVYVRGPAVVETWEQLSNGGYGRVVIDVVAEAAPPTLT